MPNSFASFVNGDIVEATHVSEMHSPIQNLERGAAFYGGSSSGSATAYTITMSPAPDSPYQAGMLVNFKIHADNEAGSPDVTLDVNSVGAKPILKDNGQSLSPGDLKAGQMVSVVYDSASGGSFRLMGAAAGVSMDLFGDGSDGDVTLSSGTLGLTRDRYYRNLTMTGTAVIRTDGYRVFVSGVLDLSNANTAALRLDGGNATGTTGGVGRGPNTVGASSAGTNGVAGTMMAGAAATSATALSPANGGNGGGTQASGAGINAGVAASGGAAGSLPTDLRIASMHLLRGASLVDGGVGGRGGSSGGGDLINAGGSGGGGGGGGGVLAVFARTIKTSVSTPAPVIRAVGGDGAAATAASAGNCGGGSGGGGGGGGFIYVVMGQRMGPAITNGLRARGGDGGSGGAGVGTGLPGSGGDGGGGGQIIQINLGQQTVTVNTGNRTALAGGSPSGATPGIGGTGRSANANL